MDYTKYSKPEKTSGNIEPSIPETVVKEEVADNLQCGKVYGCAKLNIRKKPNSDAEVVCVLPQGSDVIVDTYESTIEYYKVYTSVGLEGYCIKKYISFKQ